MTLSVIWFGQRFHWQLARDKDHGQGHGQNQEQSQNRNIASSRCLGGLFIYFFLFLFEDVALYTKLSLGHVVEKLCDL